jgi:hypothetical protein
MAWKMISGYPFKVPKFFHPWLSKNMMWHPFKVP